MSAAGTTVPTRRKLGEILSAAGVVDELQLRSALGHQRQWGGRLGHILIDLHFVDEHTLAQTLATQLALELCDLEDPPVDPAVVRLLPQSVAERHAAFPVRYDAGKTGGTLTVAFSDPTNLAAIDEVRFQTGKIIQLAVASEGQIANAIRRHYYGEEPEAPAPAPAGEAATLFGNVDGFLSGEGEPEEDLAELEPLSQEPLPLEPLPLDAPLVRAPAGASGTVASPDGDAAATQGVVLPRDFFSGLPLASNPAASGGPGSRSRAAAPPQAIAASQGLAQGFAQSFDRRTTSPVFPAPAPAPLALTAADAFDEDTSPAFLAAALAPAPTVLPSPPSATDVDTAFAETFQDQSAPPIRPLLLRLDDALVPPGSAGAAPPADQTAEGAPFTGSDDLNPASPMADTGPLGAAGPAALWSNGAPSGNFGEAHYARALGQLLLRKGLIEPGELDDLEAELVQRASPGDDPGRRR